MFKRKFLNLFKKIRPLMVIIVAVVIIVSLVKVFTPVNSFLEKEQISPAFIKSFILGSDPPLNQFKGRTNIVILGIGGGDHEGSDLTDSMMIMSVDWQKKDIVLISIPRDLWMESLKDRINTAYHYGEMKKKGGGLILIKAIIEEVIGQPVHYSWLIDFNGFKKLIDLIGGLDISVDNVFTDNLYPIAGKENDPCAGDPEFKCRYETLHFDAGLEHMDGEMILKFVRSRHAEGDEGTDFARSRRQQKVILALKNKVFQKSFILNNLKNYHSLTSAFDDATDTDMTLAEALIFGRFFTRIPEGAIRKIVLDDGDPEKGRKGFLVNPPVNKDLYGGAWVLLPRTGNFDEIHQFVSCEFEDPACNIKP